MKKKFFVPFAILTAVTMSVGGYYGYETANQPAEYSDLVLANSEALTADDETIVEKIPCFSAYVMEPLEGFVYCLTCKEKHAHPYAQGECTNVRPIN